MSFAAEPPPRRAVSTGSLRTEDDEIEVGGYGATGDICTSENVECSRFPGKTENSAWSVGKDTLHIPVAQMFWALSGVWQSLDILLLSQSDGSENANAGVCKRVGIDKKFQTCILPLSRSYNFEPTDTLRGRHTRHLPISLLYLSFLLLVRCHTP